MLVILNITQKKHLLPLCCKGSGRQSVQERIKTSVSLNKLLCELTAGK